MGGAFEPILLFSRSQHTRARESSFVCACARVRAGARVCVCVRVCVLFDPCFVHSALSRCQPHVLLQLTSPPLPRVGGRTPDPRAISASSSNQKAAPSAPLVSPLRLHFLPSLSLSLSVTHTHTHTNCTDSLSLSHTQCYGLSLSFSLSLSLSLSL